jgi:hypothetical protein
MSIIELIKKMINSKKLVKTIKVYFFPKANQTQIDAFKTELENIGEPLDETIITNIPIEDFCVKTFRVKEAKK